MATPEPRQPSERRGSKPSRRYLALLIVGVVATASILGSAYVLHWFGTGPSTCGNPTGINPRYVRFAVVISLSGYNDSAHHKLPWPIMNMSVDWDVIIHVLNNDTGQAHGFAIQHYFDQGVALRPGESCDLSFFASTSGSFRVYNIVFDTTEAFEQAQLNVNP